METYFGILSFFFGCLIGSFLNVCIYRLPKHESIVHGSSHCPSCLSKIKPYDLIPVLSYIFLGARCRSCGTKISMRYPFIELLTGISFLGVFSVFGFTAKSLVCFAFTAILIIIAMIDFDTMEIFDRFHFLILLLAILYIAQDVNHILDHMIGGLVISIPLFIVAYLTQGVGGGDVKLMGVGGFFLGVIPVFVGTMIGIFIGGIYGVYLLLAEKKNGKSMIPFGPFLCIGMYIGLLFGNPIFNWYLHLFS